MRISDWSSDVCSSDLVPIVTALGARPRSHASVSVADMTLQREWRVGNGGVQIGIGIDAVVIAERVLATPGIVQTNLCVRSEEHTSELQSLMRISYAVFCLKKKNDQNEINTK